MGVSIVDVFLKINSSESLRRFKLTFSVIDRPPNYHFHRTCKNSEVFFYYFSFASLDRKGQSLKLRKQMPVTLQKQPTISTSLGNIEHISKLNIDESADNLSISSMNSDQKKFKERQW